MAVVLETSAGELTIDLFVDECPNACLNFLKLCKYKYYNGNLFFNVQQNFLAQVGDPTGTGTGGSSIFGISKGPEHTYFRGEIKKDRKMNKVGLVGFASASASASGADGGDNLCRSQFFITLRGEDFDEGRYTIFGEVAEGFDTLQKINNLYCDEKSRPYQDVRIKHTFVLDDPFDDPEQVTFPPDSPAYEYPPSETLKRRIPYEDNLGNVDKKAEAELEASIRIKEAQSRALILEMTGDIPDADIKPPREVLFICQLNSVTRDADLQILFSTFGNIKSCQIIRDPKSGDSLNYAFIEYDNEASCVKAYEKMNNVLIDDRRIKVDFSQSVSHLWNRFTQQTRKTGGFGGVSRMPNNSAGAGGGGGRGSSGVSSSFRGSLAAAAGSSGKIAGSDYRHNSSRHSSGGVGFASSNPNSNSSITNNSHANNSNNNNYHNSNSNSQRTAPHNGNNNNNSSSSNNNHEKDRESYSEKDKNRSNKSVIDSRDRNRDRSRSESRDRRRRRDSRSPERRRDERYDNKKRDDNRSRDSGGGDSRERRDRRDRSRSESRNRRRRRESRSPERRRDERYDDNRDDNRRGERR